MFRSPTRALVPLAPFALLVLTGCPREERPLSRADALEAVEEASLSAQASELSGSGVELSTHFTIGGALEEAAGELRDFIGAQLPCAELTLSGSTLRVRYGVHPGNCTYRGHTFSGETRLTVERNDEGDVEVDHEFVDFSNGRVSVRGSAHVTWSRAEPSRHIVHELTWTRVGDGRTGAGRGDRVQRPLEGDVSVGFREDGSRSWEGQRGRWDLAIQGVEMRWADPVPQAGAFVLATPKDQSVTLSFRRVDGDTIEVTVSNGTRSFDFDVTALGVRE